MEFRALDCPLGQTIEREPMLFRRIAFGFVAALLSAGPASAGQGFIPPPPKPKCSPCVPPHEQLTKLEARRAALRAAIAQAEARLEQLQKEIAADRATVAEAGKIVVPADLAGSGIAALDQRIAANAMQQALIRVNKEEDEADLREIETEIQQLRDELNRCNQTCTGEPPPDLFNRTGGTPLAGPPDVPTPSPPPACEPCEPPAEEFARLEAERRQLSQEVDRLDREIRELEDANALEQRSIAQIQAIAKDPKYADHQGIADGMVERARQRIDDNNRAIEAKRATRGRSSERRDEIDQRLPRLRDEVYKCNSACRTPTNTRWYLIGGGAVAGGLLATTGGGSPNVTTAPPAPPAPVVSTSPPPQPTQPQPPPEPAPTVAGIHDCLDCAVVDDPSGHNREVRVCDFAGGPWEVLTASITIRHAAPFVNIEGAPFDSASGSFRGTTRGTVAGIPNVGIAFEGTASAQSGRITFTYTMGTGGELPGGRSITYSIILQKRR